MEMSCFSHALGEVMLRIEILSGERSEKPFFQLVPKHLIWNDFQRMLKEITNETFLNVKYIDDDNDEVCVSNQEDLEEAFKIVNKVNGILKFKVYINGTRMPLLRSVFDNQHVVQQVRPTRAPVLRTRGQIGFFMMHEESGLVASMDTALFNGMPIILETIKSRPKILGQLWYEDAQSGRIRCKMNDYCLEAIEGRVYARKFEERTNFQQWKIFSDRIEQRCNGDVFSAPADYKCGDQLCTKVFEANSKREWKILVCSVYEHYYSGFEKLCKQLSVQTDPQQVRERFECCDHLVEDVARMSVDNGPLDYSNASPAVARPVALSDELPQWFAKYMKKFRKDLTTELTELITHKTVRRVLRGIEKQPAVRVVKESAEMQPGTDIRHENISCFGCCREIIGPRFKCGNCANYDLCSGCETIADEIHNPDHIFMKIRRPLIRAVRKKPLLRENLYAEMETGSTKYQKEGEDVHREMRKKEKHLKEQEKLLKQEEKLLRDEERQRKREEKIAKMEEKKQKREHQQKEKDMRHAEKLKRVRERTQRDSASSKREKLDVDAPIQFNLEDLDAAFVRDETIPDGTLLKAGTAFVKKWAMKNTGRQTWDRRTKLVYITGNMGVVKNKVDVPHLLPGEEGLIQVEMVAPDILGKYNTYWILHHNGVRFGHKIWCSVVVSDQEDVDLMQFKAADCHVIANGNENEETVVERQEEKKTEPSKRSYEMEPFDLAVVDYSLQTATISDVDHTDEMVEDFKKCAVVGEGERKLSDDFFMFGVSDIYKGNATEFTYAQKVNGAATPLDLTVKSPSYELPDYTDIFPSAAPLELFPTPPAFDQITPCLQFPPTPEPIYLSYEEERFATVFASSELAFPVCKSGSSESISVMKVEAPNSVKDFGYRSDDGVDYYDSDEQLPMEAEGVCDRVARLRISSVVPHVCNLSDDEYDDPNAHCVNASDSSSDDGFYVVPLPDCFNLEKPAALDASTHVCVRKDSIKCEKSVDEMLTTSRGLAAESLVPHVVTDESTAQQQEQQQPASGYKPLLNPDADAELWLEDSFSCGSSDGDATSYAFTNSHLFRTDQRDFGRVDFDDTWASTVCTLDECRTIEGKDESEIFFPTIYAPWGEPVDYEQCYNYDQTEYRASEEHEKLIPRLCAAEDVHYDYEECCNDDQNKSRAMEDYPPKLYFLGDEPDEYEQCSNDVQNVTTGEQQNIVTSQPVVITSEPEKDTGGDESSATNQTTTNEQIKVERQESNAKAIPVSYHDDFVSKAVDFASHATAVVQSTVRDVFNTLQAKKDYIPQRSAWIPPASNWTPLTSNWTPPASNWTPPASNWTPPPNQRTPVASSWTFLNSAWTPPAPKWTPPPNDDATAHAPPTVINPIICNQPMGPMEKLIEMGFADRKVNSELLAKFNNDIQAVLHELIEINQNDWSAKRH